MAYLFNAIRSRFWNCVFWLPPGICWNDIKSTDHVQYPVFGDMYRPIGYAFIFLAIRMAFEWSIARPLGRKLGIEDTYSELPNFCRRLWYKVRKMFVGQFYPSTDTSSNGFIRSHRRSRSYALFLKIPKSTLDKFSESAWRCVYYSFIFIYGVWALWDKSWLWDLSQCWYDYPFHPIQPEIWWYYMLECSFYWSLAMSQFVDVHRKDFTMNFIHHMATIALMWFSWTNNLVRMGSLILVVHDAADGWMEAGKMANYSKHPNVCNGFFVVFCFVWFATRCGFLPFKIIYSTTVVAPSIIPFFNAYYLLNFLLITLQILHVLWSIMIIKILIGTISRGVSDDVRSDNEDEDEEESQNEKSKET